MQNRRLALPDNTEAALFFADGQYVFRSFKDGSSKVLSGAAVRQAFSNEAVDSGWLTEGVLRWGAGKKGAWAVMYFSPAQYVVRVDRSGEENGGPIRKLRCPMPGLVWCGRGENYYVWAQRSQRFDRDGALYHAPLPNVNAAGLICFGANPHVSVGKGGIRTTWETFWKAPFSTHHDQGKSRSKPESICEKLISLNKQGRYPVRDLVSMETTLEEVITVISGGREDIYDVLDQ